MCVSLVAFVSFVLTIEKFIKNFRLVVGVLIVRKYCENLKFGSHVHTHTHMRTRTRTCGITRDNVLLQGSW